MTKKKRNRKKIREKHAEDTIFDLLFTLTHIRSENPANGSRPVNNRGIRIPEQQWRVGFFP